MTSTLDLPPSAVLGALRSYLTPRRHRVKEWEHRRRGVSPAKNRRKSLSGCPETDRSVPLNRRRLHAVHLVGRRRLSNIGKLEPPAPAVVQRRSCGIHGGTICDGRGVTAYDA